MKRSGRRGGAKWPKSSAPSAARAAKTSPAGQRAPGSGTPTDLPSRNAPCPCGNGKRYKHCHGGPRSPDPFLGIPEDIVGILTDKQTGGSACTGTTLSFERSEINILACARPSTPSSSKT